MTNTLSHELLTQFKKQLEKEKQELEKALSSFATRDPNVKGDWDSKYPRTPQGNLEEAADEVEEYSTRVRLEFNLENRLKDVNNALGKMEQGTYGVCDKCSNPISQERLKVSPEARLCGECNQ